MTCRRKP